MTKVTLLYFKMIIAFAIVLAIVLAVAPAMADSSTLRGVGSSTVYPFVTTVAETFGKKTGLPTPVIEATGSGGGFKLFCAGVGNDEPDFINSSRPIKASEVKKCARSGVTPVEIRIGFDGIVIANAKTGTQLDITMRELYMALAKYVPAPAPTLSGVSADLMIRNPYVTWRDIDIRLPDIKIEVLGPPPTSGTRDSFVEIVMESGANTFPHLAVIKRTDNDHFKTLVHTLREDGAFIEAGENDNFVIQKLLNNDGAYGIFGFSFLDQNLDSIQGAIVDGVEPDFDTISDESYPISRPLFVYIKKEHIDKVGLKEFVIELISDNSSGEDGYLVDKGLIPLDDLTRSENEKQLNTELQLVTK